MRVLIDTNVVLDVLLNRKPFVDYAAQVLRKAETEIQGFVSAAAITDIYYIAYRELRERDAVKNLIRRVLSVLNVAEVSETAIFAALDSDWKDFEDSVQNSVAELHGFDAIITRNPTDYKGSALKVITPQDFIENTFFLHSI